MKKQSTVKLTLERRSHGPNKFGSYAYGIVGDIPEGVDLSEYSNIRETEDGNVIFSLEKKGKYGEPFEDELVVRSRNDRSYLNLQNEKAAEKRAEIRERINEGGQYVQAASRFGDIWANTIAGQMAANVFGAQPQKAFTQASTAPKAETAPVEGKEA